MKYLSKPTLLWAATIILSATFLRQVQQYITTLGGRSLITLSVWCAFLLCGVALSIWLKRCSRKQLIAVVLICSLAIGHALQLELAEERVHIVLFGILGFLAYTDLRKQSNHTLLRAILFCTFIATIDETVQYFLPYRVGDLRDVLFGGIGSIWGILIAWVLMEGSIESSS